MTASSLRPATGYGQGAAAGPHNKSEAQTATGNGSQTIAQQFAPRFSSSRPEGIGNHMPPRHYAPAHTAARLPPLRQQAHQNEKDAPNMT